MDQYGPACEGTAADLDNEEVIKVSRKEYPVTLGFKIGQPVEFLLVGVPAEMWEEGVLTKRLTKSHMMVLIGCEMVRRAWCS